MPPKNVKKVQRFVGREALTWVPLWCASNCCLTQLCARKSSERRPRRRQKHAQLSGRGLEWADTSSLGKWQELGWAKARMQKWARIARYTSVRQELSQKQKEGQLSRRGPEWADTSSAQLSGQMAERRQTRSRMGRMLSSPGKWQDLG